MVRAIFKGSIKPKLNRWSKELTDSKIAFVNIKGKINVLADVISKLKTLNIYKEPLATHKITSS